MNQPKKSLVSKRNELTYTYNTLFLALCLSFLPLQFLTAATVQEDHDAVNVPGAWAQGFTGKGVTVGVMDLGVYDAHVAFEGKRVDHLQSDEYIKRFANDPQWNFRNHGTHVAGIMAGRGYGVAPDADILDLTVSWMDLTQVVAETKELYLKAFDLFPEVKVYNNSWGWVYSRPQEYSGIPEDLTPIYDVFQAAKEKDKLLVFAAGNHEGLVPSSPVKEGITSHNYDGHLINVINIDAANINDPDRYVFKIDKLYGSNLGLLASLWTIAAPGTDVPSASAGTANETIEMTGTSMATPHVTGALALVQQAFPWMTAEQLADTVLTTATPSQPGYYELALYDEGKLDWQQRTELLVKGWKWNDDEWRFVPNKEERGIIAFWGASGLQNQSKEQIDEFLKKVAEDLTKKKYEEEREDLEDFGTEEDLKSLEEARSEWIKNFVETAIIAEYALGAGRLNVSAAVGGPAAVDINRLARWNGKKWTLPTGENLSGQSQINYSLILSGDGVSRFTNDITEIRWNPVLHISTVKELKSYSEALRKGEGETWDGGGTYARPDDADLPIGLIVSGVESTTRSTESTAGTLILEGKVTLSGSIDVLKNATLIVNGSVSGVGERKGEIPVGLVQSDSTGTIAGNGTITNLISRGILSPGDETAPDTVGTLTVTEKLTVEGGSILILDVGNSRHDVVKAGSIDIIDSGNEENKEEKVSFILLPVEVIEDTYEFRPADYLKTDATPPAWEKKVDEVLYPTLSFEMTPTGNGTWKLTRQEDSMQNIGVSIGLSPEAQERAALLDRAIFAEEPLSSAASKLVTWLDRESYDLLLEEPPLAALAEKNIRATYDVLKPDDHAAFDAMALERSTRLREMSGLDPIASIENHGPQSVATLHMEQDRLDTSGNSLKSKRAIITGGAQVGTEDLLFDWRLGGFTEELDGSVHNMSSKNYGFFGTVSLVTALDNVRLFGDAMVGWVHDRRKRSVWGAGNNENFDVVTSGWTAGISAGLGYQIKPMENLAILPYLKLSYDTLARGGFNEGDSPIAQSWSSDRLSAAAAEAGFDWRFDMKDSEKSMWFVKGRIAYRNRFHIEGADHYRWAGITDNVGDTYGNRHTGRLSMAIARQTSSGHTFQFAAIGEKGNSGFSRIGLEGRWSYRF